jgi:hypothetical protein
MQNFDPVFIELRSIVVVTLRRAQCLVPVTSAELEAIRHIATRSELLSAINKAYMEHGIRGKALDQLNEVKKEL